MMQIERRTLTVHECAEYLGLSVDTIYKLCRENQIRHIRIGKRILFKVESIEAWLEEQEMMSHEQDA